MRLDTLEDLYLERLRDARGACEQLRAVLPDLAAAVSDVALADILADGLRPLDAGLAALNGIAYRHDETAEAGPSEGMAGLVSEARRDALEAPFGEPPTRDALIVMHHSRLARHLATGYDCLHAFAERLHLREDAADLRACRDDVSGDERPMTHLATGETHAADA